MTAEEKTLILGALFHDIGKFVQRCTDKSKSHPTKGIELIDEFGNEFTSILNSNDNFHQFKKIISTHHYPQDELTTYCKISDHISASERVNIEENEEGGTDWNNYFLCSLFTKIKLNSDKEISPQYFKHQQLIKQNYNALIPEYEQNDEDALKYKYTESDLGEFKNQLKIVLSFYKNESDFNTLVNLLLVLLEKWLWCIPDFTGNPKTDISLFNHLKDVAGLSHAIMKTQRDKTKDKTLNLVIGDIPGIQKYIFEIVHKKASKILRGRSIFIQVLARNFASKFLDNFGLTECNLIMLAGGKFYLIAPNNNEFETKFYESVNSIEDYLAKDFYYDLGFVAGKYTFNWQELLDKEITFGEIIEKATENLNLNKTHQFKNKFFVDGFNINPQNFILSEEYIEPTEDDSNNIKCKITDKPIRLGKADYVTISDIKPIEKQVALEYKIGQNVIKDNFFLELEPEKKLSITNVYNIGEAPQKSNKPKILINPSLDDLIKKENVEKEIMRNTLFLEVANYVSTIKEKEVMDFDQMAEQNDGAKYLTLIKGDIDNLGLIMAYGLVREKNEIKDKEEEKDLTAISRTTTLSNHLKYFFSFFLNGFLKKWEKDKQEEIEESEKKINPKIFEEELKNKINENRVYTIFAGGDDLMLIAPHSSSLALLKNFNEVFTKFICKNDEIHISYSLTNFKPTTPIKIVSAMSEENQKISKTKFKNKFDAQSLKNANCFYNINDKASTYLFETIVKNNRLNDIEIEKQKLVNWVLDNNNPITMQTIRNLLQLSELIKDYEEKKDTSKLIWHPMLTYSINRNIRSKKGRYDDESNVEKFFTDVLSIYKDKEAKQMQDILYPVLCETIYKLRK